VRHKGNPSLKVADPRRSAEEFLELLRGYSHLKMLLGIEKRPSKRDVDVRIERAVQHILG
jgi:TetR/AcrR family transcriptional repressor of mexJK operon